MSVIGPLGYDVGTVEYHNGPISCVGVAFVGGVVGVDGGGGGGVGVDGGGGGVGVDGGGGDGGGGGSVLSR